MYVHLLIFTVCLFNDTRSVRKEYIIFSKLRTSFALSLSMNSIFIDFRYLFIILIYTRYRIHCRRRDESTTTIILANLRIPRKQRPTLFEQHLYKSHETCSAVFCYLIRFLTPERTNRKLGDRR